MIVSRQVGTLRRRRSRAVSTGIETAQAAPAPRGRGASVRWIDVNDKPQAAQPELAERLG